MQPEIRRLKTRSDFLRVAAARRKRVMPGLVLQAARRRPPAVAAGPRKAAEGSRQAEAQEGSEVIRVGFTASRKVGKAVARNRARRRLRAAAAEVLPALGRPGYDYVLVARQGTLTRRYADLVSDLRGALGAIDREKAPSGSRRRGQTQGRRRPDGQGDTV